MYQERTQAQGSCPLAMTPASHLGSFSGGHGMMNLFPSCRSRCWLVIVGLLVRGGLFWEHPPSIPVHTRGIDRPGGAGAL